ncbi:MAG: cytochrome b/b6 domain-containing protein [Anaerolineae bacterium]
MKRLRLPSIIILSWLLLIGTAGAQIAVPPQSALLNDALFLVKAAPFIIALAIGVGIAQARAAANGGGDALLGDKVRRHDLSTVIAHWANAIGVILGLASGAIVLRWVEYRPELRWVFAIHNFGAALMLFGIFNHLARHGVSGGFGLIPKTFRVLRDVIGELFEYIGVFGPKGAVFRIPWPKAIRRPVARYVRAMLGYKEDQAGKYLATEQILSYLPWTILMIVIVMTGFIKLAKYLYAIPGSVLLTATALHDLATLAIGVMLIIHLLPLLLIPANWPLLGSMFKTTVPRKYVEERHPLWFKKLKSRPNRPEPVRPTGPEYGAIQPADAD